MIYGTNSFKTLSLGAQTDKDGHISFDPKAEENCESLLRNAFEVDADNVEALICQSSFQLSQQRPDEARESALKAWGAWKELELGI